MRSRACVVFGLAVLVVATSPTRAARVPVRTFTIADGLARDDVARVRLDSRGFLWAATAEGLSRFDGIRFVTYGEADGLPSDDVSDIIEASDGSYWVATARGLARHAAGPAPEPGAHRAFFEPVLQGSPEGTAPCRVLHDDGAGGVWVGKGTGLYHVRRVADGFASEREELGVDASLFADQVNAIVEDRPGQLWIATRGLGALRRGSDGVWAQWTEKDGLPSPNVRDLLVDRDGRVWLACGGGLARLPAHTDAHQRPELVLAPSRDGFPNDNLRTLAQGNDGRLFVGLQPGFAQVRCDATHPGCEVTRINVVPERSSVAILDLAIDRDGRVWIGSGSGLLSVDVSGTTCYGVEDGLVSTQVVTLLETSRGVACVASNENSSGRVLHLFENGRWLPIPFNIPSPIGGWGSTPLVVEDRERRWWVPGGRGVWRFPPLRRFEDLARATPDLVATRREGLPSDEVFRLWEDSRGDVWISAYGLAVWERATGRVKSFSETPGAQLATLPSAFAEDREGHVWIGDYSGRILHYARGSFESLGAAEGVPSGVLTALHIDAHGRLWVGTSNGAARLDDPDGPSRTFHRMGTSEGLSSREISAIVEGRNGTIFFAGARGVDRLDPLSGRIDSLTVDAGIEMGTVALALADHQGVLWFAAPRGIFRVVPRSAPTREPPATRVFGIRVAGEPRPVPALGTLSADGLSLDGPKRRLEVDFAAVDAGMGASYLYEHRLEGGDNTWSPPSPSHFVELANLAPGRYRLAVRAVARDGRPGPEASVPFVVRPPAWRRPEALGGAAGVLGLALWWGHRRRLARALELERVRTRIATDLHDDLGSTLSQIAIVSEVVRRRLPEDANESAGPLARIAENAREAVESLADIVWSVDPKQDRLSDLVQRMRRFAEEMAVGAGMKLRFVAPAPEADRLLGADVRRALYLAAKESVNNAVRHSGARTLDVALTVDRDRIVLEVRDDGRGFVTGTASSGHGVASLRRRAEELGGRCEIAAYPGGGTSVTFAIPQRGAIGPTPV